MKKLFQTIAAVGLGLAVASGSASAAVLADFEVTPSALGSGESPFTADKITGNYAETFTVTSITGVGSGTFVTDAYWTAGQFVTNDGTTALLAGTTGLGVDYVIYALFTATGTFTTDAGTGEVTFVATGGSLELWADFIDPETTFALPADAQTGNVTVGGTGDPDQLLATAPLFTGTGDANPVTLESGNFELIFQPFNLTALGSSVFTDPVPFYFTVNVAGQFNSFDVEGSQQVEGSADAWFSGVQAPEPASMTLFGLTLFGAGLAARRRRT
jgi:hypothetical protein